MSDLERDLGLLDQAETLDRDDPADGVDHDEVLDRYWEKREYSEAEQELAFRAITNASGRGEVSVLALEILRMPLRDPDRWLIAAEEAIRREGIGLTAVFLELPHLLARFSAVLLPVIEADIADRGWIDRRSYRKKLLATRVRATADAVMRRVAGWRVAEAADIHWTWFYPCDGYAVCELWVHDTQLADLGFEDEEVHLWTGGDPVSPDAETVPGVERWGPRVVFVKKKIEIPRAEWERFLRDGAAEVRQKALKLRETWKPEWGEI